KGGRPHRESRDNCASMATRGVLGGVVSQKGWEVCMRKVLGLAGAALLLAGPALAADLPVRAPVKAPPPVVPVFTWTGFYFGGNIGGVDEHASGTSDFIDTGFPPTSRFFSNPQNQSFSNTRVIGGVQGGYNWQFSPQWVAGFEADWDFTNV